jgi:predicted Zn-dependent peptidase
MPSSPRLEKTPITEQELAKALKRAKAEFVLAGESITGQAQLLGMTEAVIGDYTRGTKRCWIA